MAANPVTNKPGIKIPRMILFSFFLFTVGILILVRVYYGSQITRINQEAQESLTAISLLKISQIDQWHIERLGNANQILYNNPLLKSLEQYIKYQNHPETEADIKKWTKYMSDRLDYNSVFIYDTLLNSRLATTQSDTELTGIVKIASVEALKDMKVRMTDIYLNGTLGEPAIDLVIPLVSNNKKQSRPFGLIVLRIDPAKTLFPLIQSWPTPSKTAETLLIRKDSDSVLYLNDLRHIQNTALILKLPLSDVNLPAAKAVNGFTGVVNGVDYRNVPVLSYVSSIPDLSWFMVAKVDKEEIQAPLKEFSLISVIVTVLLIVIVASVLLFWIRNQQFIESRENLRTELERKQLDEALIISESRYRRLFEAARDGILILEAETGLIVDVNPYLVEMLGVTREQFLKKSIWEIGFFNDIAANKDKFLELQHKEYVRYEDLPLETVDGRKFHVEFVSNVYQVSGYNVIQCNIRDITKRKEMVDELNKQNSMINALLANLQIGVYMIEVPSGIPLLANESSFNLLGRGILPEANSNTIAKVYDLYKTGTDIPYPNEELPLVVAMSGVSKHVDDMEVKKPDGTRIALEVFGSPIRDNSGNIWASLVSFQDITERKLAEEEIKTKVAELERFNRLSVGREMRMIELKQKINDLSAQLNLPHPYAMEYLKSTNGIPDIGKKDI